MENLFKNIILAGIGAVSYSYEKASKLVDELVEKGGLTISQGKQINEELKMKFEKTKRNEQKENVLTVESLKDALANLNLATREDLEQLKERISKLENK